MMKKALVLALLFAIFNLHAEEEESISTVEDTGFVAASAVEVSKSSNWQNWVFASSALVTVVVGVVIISLNSGTTSH